MLPERPPRTKVTLAPWPDWLEWQPNRVWIYDATHFPRAKRVAFAIVDMVSRKWVRYLLSIEETSTQVQVVFEQALIAEGLDALLVPERLELDEDDPERPILLTLSDNGPPMAAQDTCDFSVAPDGHRAALRSTAHPDRPGLGGELLRPHQGRVAHLEQITDPVELDRELARDQAQYNTTRRKAPASASPARVRGHPGAQAARTVTDAQAA